MFTRISKIHNTVRRSVKWGGGKRPILKISGGIKPRGNATKKKKDNLSVPWAFARLSISEGQNDIKKTITLWRREETDRKRLAAVVDKGGIIVN